MKLGTIIPFDHVQLKHSHTSILGDRIPLPKGTKGCNKLVNVPCSECAKYYSAKIKHTENRKCVYVPKMNGCKSKDWVLKKKEAFQENCTGNK